VVLKHYEYKNSPFQRLRASDSVGSARKQTSRPSTTIGQKMFPCFESSIGDNRRIAKRIIENYGNENMR